MKFRSLLQNSLLPIESVQLGRLVFNARNPQQDFLDPPNLQLESTVKHQEKFEEILNLSKNSKLRSHLTALLSISYENQGGGVINMAATRATTYQLLNSGAWFKKACSLSETREWFESAIETSRTVYLVVGFHTLTDARVAEIASTSEKTSGGTRLNAATLVGGPPQVMSNLLDSRISIAGDVSYGQWRSFNAPGEQIYAIQYRKVKFKWYSSRNIDKVSLERENRWKVCWTGGDIRGNSPLGDADDNRSDGGEGEEEEYEEEEYEEDDEEELDMLEADLTDEIDFEFKEAYTSEDGEEEFIF